MRSRLILLASLVVLSHSYLLGQKLCESPTLGYIYDFVKKAASMQRPIEHYKVSPGFDFNSFTGSSEKIDSVRIEIGYDYQGKIGEIVFHLLTYKGIFSFSLLAFEFSDCRVLLVKRNRSGPYLDQSGSSSFGYTAVALLCMKNGKGNYMINTVSQFAHEHLNHTLFDTFPLNKIEDVSCIMELNDRLFPTCMLKISNGKIVSYSRILYRKGSNVLSRESLGLFVDQQRYYPTLTEVVASTIVDKLIDEIESIEPNWSMVLTPETYGQPTLPLWVFNGAHSYEAYFER